MNELGVDGIWECRPSCDADMSAEERTAAREREIDPLESEAVGNELRRWQDAIHDKMIGMGVPDFKIDGAGCDSGDPLDFTLAEVGQGLAHFIDQLEAARNAER